MTNATNDSDNSKRCSRHEHGRHDSVDQRYQSSSTLSSVPSKDYKERVSIYSAHTKVVDFDDDENNKKKKKKRSSNNHSPTSTEIGTTITDSSTRSESDTSIENENETNNDDELVQLLALQSYHLPGNNWIQDFVQFMGNNHPIFGICCFSKLHPIKAGTRIVALIGTIAFGIALANLCYVFFLWNPELDRVIVRYTTDADDGTEQVVFTTGMLLLWTVGGSIHCLFNLAMWHIAACACCQRGGWCAKYAYCPNLGSKMMRIFVVCTVLLCILILLLRVAINDKEDEEQQETYQEEQYDYDYDEYNNNINNDNSNNTTTIYKRGIDIFVDDELKLSVESISEFTFVFSYLIEMVLSLFVYYPMGVIILFSGILSCGCSNNIPVLGGRPYEIACEERRRQRRYSNNSAKQQRQSSRKSASTTTTTNRGLNTIIDLDLDIEQNTDKS